MAQFFIAKDDRTEANAFQAITAARKLKGVIRIDISEDKMRTNPQLRTLWMWHGQMASQLTIQTGTSWKSEDVHELLFKVRFMPYREVKTPAGRIERRPMGTSDTKSPIDNDERSVRKIISDAMTEYLVWIYQHSFEVTVPEEREWKA